MARISLLLFMMIFLSIPACAGAAPQVKVTGGTIQGYEEDGVKIFKGIPYADTTAGKNRWREPQPVKSWQGVKDCTKFGQIAVQNETTATFDPWTNEYLDFHPKRFLN